MLGQGVRRLLGIAIIAALGTTAAGYVLVNQRLSLPFRDTYDVRATLESADGIAPGVGQSVNVSGVRVGAIKEAVLADGKAVLTLEIQRRQVPHVHRDARVTLQPITPVKDMQIELDPGSEDEPKLADGDRIPSSQTSVPVELSTLLGELDTDTRGFMTALITGLGDGTKGRAVDFRRIMLAFGPTTAQVRELTEALASRRKELARLVSNVSAVTRAASADGRLADLVDSGNRTLQAVADQDRDLRRAMTSLPGALETADSALRQLGHLGSELGPAARELTPALRGAPKMLRSGLTPIADQLERSIRTQIRPLSSELQPLARALRPALSSTSALLPDLSRTLQGLVYALNILGYNPPGKEEGLLYWLAWGAHNYGSSATNGDAHGATVRAAIFLDCKSTTTLLNLRPLFNLLLGKANPCQGT